LAIFAAQRVIRPAPSPFGPKRSRNGLFPRKFGGFRAIFRLTRVFFGRCFRLAAAIQRLARRLAGAEGALPVPVSFPEYKDVKEMSKKDLIDAVAAATELTKEKAGVAVDAVIAHIETTMKKGEEVRIPGFGTFKVAKRAARKARNPQTGMEMMLKASRVPKFQASKNLKEILN
jgi:DNA-binding protein HU-beta